MSERQLIQVCTLDDLEENWGEAALINGHQYAVFRHRGGGVFITDHADPKSGALVIARGILGEKGGVPTVTSPLYKEEYSLETGECVSGADLVLPVYEVVLKDGAVYLALEGAADEDSAGK